MKLAILRSAASAPATGWRYLLDQFDPTGAHCGSETPSLKS